MQKVLKKVLRFNEGNYKFCTPLMFLASTLVGQKLLKDDTELLNKITSEGLNTLVVEGEHKGCSVLLFLAGQPVSSPSATTAFNPYGRQLLIDDEVLRAKITDVGLNAVIAEGLDKGRSALFCLAGNTVGQQLLLDDAELLGKITDKGLNAVIAEGEDKGESALC